MTDRSPAEQGDLVETRIDPRKPHQIVICGRRGQGKSELAYRFWETWPYDRLVIDVTGDVGRVHPEEHTHDLVDPLPARWPGGATNDERVSLRYVPDPGSPTYRDDMDRAVGLAYAHRRTLLWVEEIGEVAPANRTLPHMRRALHQGRHRDLTLMVTGPRPMDIDPLVLANADYVYVFDLPNPDDRKRIADAIGFDRSELDAGVAGLEDHGYLRFDASAHELIDCPPIPWRKPIARRPPS